MVTDSTSRTQRIHTFSNSRPNKITTTTKQGPTSHLGNWLAAIGSHSQSSSKMIVAGASTRITLRLCPTLPRKSSSNQPHPNTRYNSAFNNNRRHTTTVNLYRCGHQSEPKSRWHHLNRTSTRLDHNRLWAFRHQITTQLQRSLTFHNYTN